MVLVLQVMIVNLVALYDNKISIAEPSKTAFKAIENPPVLKKILQPHYLNQVIFPDKVVDMLA